jgi:hypothetical protein
VQPWDAELLRVGVELHRALRAHPAAIHLLLSRNEPPPGFVAAADKLLAMLVAAGLDRTAAIEGLAAFQSHVLGHTVLGFSHSGADEQYGHRPDVRPGLHMLITHLRSQLAT